MYCTPMRATRWPAEFIEILFFVMANSYQLVAWTDKGQVRMIPSEVTAYLHAEMAVIDRMADKIRYLTVYERSDIFRVSQSYEKLAVRMMDLGRTEDAFELYVQAKHFENICLKWPQKTVSFAKKPSKLERLRGLQMLDNQLIILRGA